MGISREKIQQAAELGGGVTAIAERLGLTVMQLRSACRQHHLKSPLMTRAEIDRALPRAFLREAVRTKTVSEIARDKGLPISTVADQLKRCGIKPSHTLTIEAKRRAALAQRAADDAEGDRPGRYIPAIDLEPEGDPMGRLLQGARYGDNTRAATRRNDYHRGAAPIAGGYGCSSLVFK
jgi:hypothetical protein